MTDVKKLLDEATPLPWSWGTHQMERGGTATIVRHDDQPVVPSRSADAALIVHAVNHLPDYEAAVDALERLINVGDALWEDHPPVWMTEADDARAVLRRLRGEG